MKVRGFALSAECWNSSECSTTELYFHWGDYRESNPNTFIHSEVRYRYAIASIELPNEFEISIQATKQEFDDVLIMRRVLSVKLYTSSKG